MAARSLIATLFAATSMLLLGCQPGSVDSRTDVSGAPETAHDHEHDHDAPGPHGGHLIVLGEEEYHAELTHDESTHTVTVYLLDGAAESPATDGPAEIVLQLFLDGDFVDYALKSGDDGAYMIVDETLCDRLLHDEHLKGRLRVTLAGQEFVGVIDHSAHEHGDHEEHDHDEHDHGPDEHDHDH